MNKVFLLDSDIYYIQQKLYRSLAALEIGRTLDTHSRKIPALSVSNKPFSSYKNLYGRLIKLSDCVLPINKTLSCLDVMLLLYQLCAYNPS